MNIPSFRYERPYWQRGMAVVAGVDEVGVGALAGPVVAGAVIFRPEKSLSVSQPPSSSPLSGGKRIRRAGKINHGLVYLPYFQQLTEQAREMRYHPTQAEKVMWEQILSREFLKQYRFRHQKPLQRFIADFYSPALLLVVEVDGDSHDKQHDYDSARTESLSDYGIQVLRYTNGDILQNSDRVYKDLVNFISQRVRQLHPPDRGDLGGFLIRDSKTLSGAQREKAAVWIKEHALAWAVGEASVAEIDQFNIRGATGLAMQRAIAQLSHIPEVLLLDGMRAPGTMPAAVECIVKGDAQSWSIAAASIVAKVYRDGVMTQLHEQYPGYGLASHKGYGAATHLAALKALGASPIHRKTYAPVAAVLSSF